MAHPRRPDPAQGVFETLLVLDGRPVELEAHVARLEASLTTLFPTHLTPPLDVPSLRHPYGDLSEGTSGSSAIRVTVAPDEQGALALRVELRKAQRGTDVALASLPFAGGLGPHKWADRSLLEEAQVGMPAGALPLILDENGAVLEASRANLFAVRDETLHTPPLDGRILPGVTRARVLEIARATGVEIREERLTRGDLLAADEVFLTGSVRGIERVKSLDGVLLRGEGWIGARLADELQRAWADTRAAA